MLEKHYELLRNKATDIENKFRNMLDNREHGISKSIADEFTKLIVDIRQKKHPRTLEDRVYRIQQHLSQTRNESVIMRVEENVELDKHCEQFRSELRKLPSYQ